MHASDEDESGHIVSNRNFKNETHQSQYQLCILTRPMDRRPHPYSRYPH